MFFADLIVRKFRRVTHPLPFIGVILLVIGCGREKPLSIIPAPAQISKQSGEFQLNQNTIFVSDAPSRDTAEFIAAQLRKSTGYQFPVQLDSENHSPENIIQFTTKSAKSSDGDEGYELAVSPKQILLTARTQAGLFYAAQTLLQLLPPSVLSDKPAANTSWKAPCVNIQDAPRFLWRGMMLDVCRHFFTMPELKKILDGMALHKLNRFHWHLSDDQGWRIEIKKYPRLTEIGAWRKSIGFGLDPKASTAYRADGKYGGFYTQEEIREIVNYAMARHITVMPEIEMPGHASAALMAYPQYSCTGGPFTTDLPGGIFDGIFCAGNDETFTFLQDVLNEVFQLFPDKYVHIGGDEVLTNSWHGCVKCQARKKELGLTNDIALEHYFVHRIEKYVTANHRTLIGWSEIREGGLPENSAMMDWAGGAVEAAEAGHDVVMCPLADCYFDHYQAEDRSNEPHAIGGFLPLNQVYAFEPIPPQLAPKYHSRILGAQANVWTEYMPSLNHVEYMVFPRLCALAELDWSPKNARNWDSFFERLQTHFARMQSLGLNYRQPAKSDPKGKDGK